MKQPARGGLRPGGGFQGQIADVDLRLLRVFRTVAQHGGFAAAEVALVKSKSSISLDMAALESRLNLRLCRRGRAGFSLTAAGREVLAAVDELLCDLDRFKSRVNAVSGVLSGPFMLYVPDSILTYGDAGLIEGLRQFASAYPQIKLSLRSTSTEDIELAVIGGQANAGITLYPPELPEAHATPLLEEILYLHCGRGHPLFSVPDEDITVDMLARQRMIAVSDAAGSASWDRIRAQMDVQAVAANLDSRALLILTGHYIGFLPERFARGMIASGTLRRIASTMLSLTARFYLVLPQHARDDVVSIAFRRMIEGACA